MTRCIIHIGMHKTGSTSIQMSLHGFSDANFSYANLGKFPNHSLPMYSLFADKPEQHHLHKVSKLDHKAVQAYNKTIQARLEQSIEDARDRTLIISGEEINVLPQANLHKLRQYFLPRISELTIVGYVRPPAGYMTSGFQQRVKGGLVKELKLGREYRNYKTCFSKFDEAFGKANVHLWKFDPQSFPGGCVVRDFCKRLGVGILDDQIVRVNESISRLAISLLYIYQKYGNDYGAGNIKALERQQIIAKLSSLGNSKFRFSPDVIKPVLEKNRADIEWMEARLGMPLREELGEYQSGDVRDESDLIRTDPLVIDQLRVLLGEFAPAGIKGETPEEIALLVHSLRKMSTQEGLWQRLTKHQPRLKMGKLF